MPTAITTGSKTSSWSKMFPEVTSAELSTTFVKKLFAVALSNVLYLRGIFPETGFMERNLEGIKLKIIRDDSRCPGCEKVCSWVRGCFDALDKKYLKKVMIGFYALSDNESQAEESLVEAYHFKFDYYTVDGADSMSVGLHREVHSGAGVDAMSQDMFSSEYSSQQQMQPQASGKAAPPGVTTPDAIRETTIRLLRTIIMASQTVAPLADNVVMKMRLFYHDCAPEDYEPPGFRADPDGGASFHDQEIELRLGDVFTKYNGFRMVLSTCRDYFREEGNSGGSKNCSSSKTTKKAAAAAAVADNPPAAREPSPRTESLASMSQDKPAGSADNADDDDEELSVRCPCERDIDAGIMIRCEACQLWQHAVCFGILRERDAPTIHFCDVCIESKFSGDTGELPAGSHDSLLQRMRPPVERRSFCLVRAALNVLLELDDPVTPARLAKRLSVPTQSAVGIVKKLTELGALMSAMDTSGGGDASSAQIDRLQLRRNLLPKFFTNRAALERGKTTATATATGTVNAANADEEAVVGVGKRRVPPKRPVDEGESETQGAAPRPPPLQPPPSRRGRGRQAAGKQRGGGGPAGATPKPAGAAGAVGTRGSAAKRARYGSVVNTPLRV